MAKTKTSNKKIKYFIVSPQKIAIMSLGTVGFYEVYWMYKQWQAVGYKPGLRLGPFIRAIFGPITLYWLLKHLKVSRAGTLALCFLAINSTWRLPGLLWLVSVLTFVPLMTAQKEINQKMGVVGQGNQYSTFAKIVIPLGLILLFAEIFTS